MRQGLPSIPGAAVHMQGQFRHANAGSAQEDDIVDVNLERARAS